MDVNTEVYRIQFYCSHYTYPLQVQILLLSKTYLKQTCPGKDETENLKN